MQCAAKTKKSGFRKRCALPSLSDEEHCIFHTKSERGRQFRNAPRKRRGFDRESLLRELVRDYKDVGKMSAKPIVKARLRATISGQILELLRDLQRIDELEKLIEEKLG